MAKTDQASVNETSLDSSIEEEFSVRCDWHGKRDDKAVNHKNVK